MPGFNHIELDEVHTPSRYIALFSFVPWEVHCAFQLFAFHRALRRPVANQVMSFLALLARTLPQ